MEEDTKEPMSEHMKEALELFFQVQEKLGITAKALADKVDFHPHTVSRWKHRHLKMGKHTAASLTLRLRALQDLQKV